MIIFYVESVPFFTFWQSLFVSPEVAVAIVVGVDDDGLHHNLGVNHDELQLVTARSDISEVDLQPADIIKDLVATKHLDLRSSLLTLNRSLVAVLPAAEQQVVVWGQELQLLRLRKVLGRVFTKLVMQSLTGIVYRCLR